MPINKPLVSICIASHNMKHLVEETLLSVLIQEYTYIEVILLDDASSDGTEELFKEKNKRIKYFKSETPSGTGGAFNKAISHATGDIIILMCADDIFTDEHVISDIVEEFRNESVGHVTRYYHQFIDGDPTPVRAWRCNDVIELANNPSGLAFRASALNGCELSNKMFVEASTLVSSVLKKGWKYRILRYDTVAVRIHNSISQNKNYYLKMWNSSPVEEWKRVGGDSLLRDYTSLIQIKNNFRVSAVAKEGINFIRYRPISIIHPAFWFFYIVSLFTPRFILRKLPNLYRRTIGKWTTGEKLR